MEQPNIVSLLQIPSSAPEVATCNWQLATATAESGESIIIVGNMAIVRAKLNSEMYVSAQKEREIKQRRVGNFKKMAPCWRREEARSNPLDIITLFY